MTKIETPESIAAQQLVVNKDWESLLMTLAKKHIGDYTVINEGNTILLKINGATLHLYKDKLWAFSKADLVESMQTTEKIIT